MLIKLGASENNYIIDFKSCQDPIPLLIYEDHVMLYDINITFKGRVYKNTYQLLESLIIDGTLKSMTMNEKSTLLNILGMKMLIK